MRITVWTNTKKKENNVEIFERMQHPLISSGKLITNGCNILFDSPNAHILTSKTKHAVRNAIKNVEENNSNDILMVLLFDNNTLTWKVTDNPDRQVPTHITNNVHQIRSKAVLLDYLHWTAGYPVKQTWSQAINTGFYST